MLSESPERFLLVTTKERHREVTDILYTHGVRNVVIGEAIDHDAVEFSWKKTMVASIPLQFALTAKSAREFSLVKFPPMLKRLDAQAPVSLKPKQTKKKAQGEWDEIRALQRKSANADGPFPCPANLEDVWLDLLANPNLCSRRLLSRLFDHRVGGRTVSDMGGDAGIVRIPSLPGGARGPTEEGGGEARPTRALAATVDCNSLYLGVDPYLGTIHSVAEGIRNLAAMGARPVALAHCLNFGDPARYREICDLSEAVRAIGDASREWGVPVASDSVDLFNGSEANPILPVPAICLVGVVADVTKAGRSSFRRGGDIIYLLGETRNEIGCSEYASFVHRMSDGLVPDIDFKAEQAISRAIITMYEHELLSSAHDLSAGGLAVAFAECAMGRGVPIGATLTIEDTLGDSFRQDAMLFSETGGRFIISFPEEKEEDVKTVCSYFNIPITGRGIVGGKEIAIRGAVSVELPLQSAYRIWAPGLRVLLGLKPESVAVLESV